LSHTGLIQEIKAGQIDVVVAYKIDRITRYLPDFYEFWKILTRKNGSPSTFVESLKKKGTWDGVNHHHDPCDTDGRN